METTKLDFEHSDFMLWNYNSTYRYRINQGGTWSGKTYSILQALLVLSVTDKKPTVTTVTGQTLSKDLEHADMPDGDVVRSLENPVNNEGGLIFLTGSLAPEGALVKTSAVPSWNR